MDAYTDTKAQKALELLIKGFVITSHCITWMTDKHKFIVHDSCNTVNMCRRSLLQRIQSSATELLAAVAESDGEALLRARLTVRLSALVCI